MLLHYNGYKIFYAQFYEFKIVSLWSVMGRFVGAFGMYELRVIGVRLLCPRPSTPDGRRCCSSLSIGCLLSGKPSSQLEATKSIVSII